MHKRLITGLLAIAMMFALVGCDEKAPPTPPQVSSQPEPVIDPNTLYEVDSLPVSEIEGEDSEFVNQLELVNNQLLLPLAITVTDKIPISEVPSVSVGGKYSLSPNSLWLVKASTDTATFYHEAGIAVQLTMCETGSRIKAEDLSNQLDGFYESFVEKSEPAYRDVFLADKLAGKEVSFQIEHDGKDMFICVGSFVDSKSVVIYTVNYFIPETGSSTISEQINNLFSTFTASGKRVSIK